MNKTFDRSMKRHLKKGCIHLAPIERSSSLTEQRQASSSNVGVVAQLWCQFWCLLSVQLNLGLVQLGAVLGKLADRLLCTFLHHFLVLLQVLASWRRNRAQLVWSVRVRVRVR